jgi:hypothetical protein
LVTAKVALIAARAARRCIAVTLRREHEVNKQIFRALVAISAAAFACAAIGIAAPAHASEGQWCENGYRIPKPTKPPTDFPYSRADFDDIISELQALVTPLEDEQQD